MMERNQDGGLYHLRVREIRTGLQGRCQLPTRSIRTKYAGLINFPVHKQNNTHIHTLQQFMSFGFCSSRHFFTMLNPPYLFQVRGAELSGFLTMGIFLYFLFAT